MRRRCRVPLGLSPPMILAAVHDVTRRDIVEDCERRAGSGRHEAVHEVQAGVDARVAQPPLITKIGLVLRTQAFHIVKAFGRASGSDARSLDEVSDEAIEAALVFVRTLGRRVEHGSPQQNNWHWPRDRHAEAALFGRPAQKWTIARS